jgi:hypothetical protein
MMTIVYVDGSSVKWNLGEIPINLADRVVEVRADKDELKFIQYSFPTVNMPNVATQFREVHWFGDEAKFIVANIKPG